MSLIEVSSPRPEALLSEGEINHVDSLVMYGQSEFFVTKTPDSMDEADMVIPFVTDAISDPRLIGRVVRVELEELEFMQPPSYLVRLSIQAST